MDVIRLLGSALAKFGRDRGFFLAAAIAFQVLLCLVPFTLLLLSFAGSYLFTHDDLVDHLGRYLQQAAPALDPTVQRTILDLVGNRGTFGLVGTIGLLWAATTVFGGLRVALNLIFDVPRARGTLRGLGLDLVMIALTGGTFLLSVVLTAVITYLQRAPAPVFFAAVGPLLGFVLAYLVPLLLTFLVCYQIYHIVPNRKVSARAAFRGALFSAVLWEAAKHLFAWYVPLVGRYSLVYGSLGAAVVLLVWIYYSAAVLLLGGEVAALLDGVSSRKAQGTPRQVATGG